MDFDLFGISAPGLLFDLRVKIFVFLFIQCIFVYLISLSADFFLKHKDRKTDKQDR